ncbi:hypothetical protein [Gloeobacter violaceus]|uniref:Gll3903 protein n=1 Tax=Gloeobacter violaceus (strain ATCC 29082 / PCC 7421) TaxID=251221 RepID=Q7NEH6_GLOVI|nr:hypothetical protein [Gloeobacter violaceus]BAC91844.1 gll3903 [Gloeobacter violaceus PCC 7421]
MTFLREQWKKRFDSASQAGFIPESSEPSIAPLLSGRDAAASEPLVPDPEWDGIEPVHRRQWQRPVLFVLAGMLLLAGGGYALAQDWWLVRQRHTLDRQIERTANSVQSEAARKGAEVQTSIEQLLEQDGPPRPVLTLPPPPPPPAAPPRFAQMLPPPVRQLPPLPPLAAPPSLNRVTPLPPPVRPAQEASQTKIALIGGNERVVLLEVEGERVQLAPGQSGPRSVTVVSAHTSPGRYRVRVRQADGRAVELSLVSGAATTGSPPEALARLESSVPPPVPSPEQITPLY